MGGLRYKPDLSVNVVLNQLIDGKEIAENDSIQKGSVIDLVLGKGLSNQRTAVPDLIGLALEPARNRILSAGLNLGTYIFDGSVLSGEDSLKSFVFKQSPEFFEESTLQLGSSIYIWMTTDSLKLPADSSSVAIPDSIQLPDLIPGTNN
jgi:beta-lactam-binding protein with PASTA domain